MSQRKPSLSLVVCTLGRRTELERTLASFTEQTTNDFEVVIVDQNRDGYLDGVIDRFSRELNIRWLKADPGLSRARNVGLRYVRGRVVGFPDDDCWYAPGVCQRVLDYFASRPKLALLTGRTIDSKGKESLSGDFRSTAGPIYRRDVFRTGNSNTLFVRRDVVLSVGGFDEGLGLGAPGELQSGEETDLVIRCVIQHFETHYDPAFTVFHDQVCGDRTEDALRRAREYSVGFGHLIRRHGFGRLYFCYRVARSIAKAMIHVAQLDLWNARLRLNWARGTIRGFLSGSATHTADESADPHYEQLDAA